MKSLLFVTKKKLNTLTTLQQLALEDTRQFWINHIYSNNNLIDKNRVVKGIEWLYSLAGYRKPEIIFVDSPLAAQYVAKKMQSKPHADETYSGVWPQVWQNICRKVEEEVLTKVAPDVQSEVRSKINHEVINDIRSKVWTAVKSTIEPLIGFTNFGYHGNIGDCGWIAYFDYYTRLGIVNNRNFNRFKELMLSGVYDMIQSVDYCIVCSMPERIQRNTSGHLHCSDGPAISWRDGYSLYYWNGIDVPKEWIVQKEMITGDIILSEKNPLRQNCLKEILGAEAFYQKRNCENSLDKKELSAKIMPFETGFQSQIAV